MNLLDNKTGKLYNKRHDLTIVFFIMAVFFVLAYFLDGGITGFVVYQQTENTKQWDFTNPIEYSYDDSLIELSNGARLVPEIEIITIEDYSYEDSYVIEALYNLEDKTSQISSIGSGHINTDKDKMLNVIFDHELNNGDIISLYIRESNENDIYLCSYNTSCNSPGYGLISYNGDEGWYNISISGLSSPVDRFNIDPDHIKIDYIYANKIINNSHNIENITYPDSATIDTEDFSAENFGGWGLLSTDESLNGQTINYYYSTDSAESWNLISDFNLSSVSSSTIRLRAELISDGIDTPVLNSLTLNYLTSVACEEHWECGNWGPEECPENETLTRICTDLNECESEDNKPETIRNCQYCIENWTLYYNECIANDSKIKYYTDRNNCGTTSNLAEDNGSYVECDYCTPSWSCLSYGGCQSDNKKYCDEVIDTNNCYNITGLVADDYSGDYSEFIILCSYDNNPPTISNILVMPNKGAAGIIVNISLSVDDESNISSAEAIILNSNEITIKKLLLEKNNNLYIGVWDTTNTTKGTYLIGINVSDINKNNAYYKQRAIIALDSSAKGSFTNNSVSLIKNQTIVINATETTDAIIEITSKNDLNVSISTVQYSENLKNTTPSKEPLGKYLDIIVDDGVNNNITKVKIVIYYNDSDVNNADIDENTLKIYYYNETSEDWQILSSGVNTTANYVWAELSHFSTYGVFGEQKSTPSSGSGRGGGGGGSRSGSGTVQTTSTEKDEVKEKEIVKEPETVEEKKPCSYSLTIDLPDKISFVESDTVKGIIKNNGNCDIDEVDLSLDKNLIDLMFIENQVIDEIGVNETKEIYLKRKKTISEKMGLSGFAVMLVEKSSKSYGGELISRGVTNDAVVVQKNVPVDVEVLLPIEEMVLNPFLFLISIIMGIIFIIFRKKIMNR